MKVLIINTFIEGTSTAKIATGLYRKLIENGHECLVLYGAGDESDNSDFIKIASDVDIKMSWFHNQITGVHGNFSPFVMPRIYKIINDFKPDIVQLYNLHYYYLDIYKLFDYLKKKEISTVYGMLDEYPYMGYCCYPYDCEQYKTGCRDCDSSRFKKEYPRNLFFNGARKTIMLKEKSYADFKQLVFTGPEFVIDRARESYLLNNKYLEILDEYVDNETVFVPKDTGLLRRELKIPEENIVVLNVAPSNDPRKGVSDYVLLAEQMKENKKYTFVHVGYQGDVELLPDNFAPIPFVRDQHKLADYYSLADIFVCTSYADTMPNVCLDALSCGTPIIGYDVSGVPYVAEEPYGYFVEPGNITALEKILNRTNKKGPDKVKMCREYALKRYSPWAYYKRTMDIYQNLRSE